MPYLDKEKSDSYQKEYQPKYRAENKDKASDEHRKWRKKTYRSNNRNSGEPWAAKDIDLILERKDGKRSRSIKELMVILGRSYCSISAARRDYKDREINPAPN